MKIVPHKALTTDEEISAFLHRTRIDILSVLRHGKATVSQIAEKLDVHPANLSRHVKKLESSGLIELVERRDTGRNLEKYYATTALTFEVCADADQLSSPQKIALSFARSELSAAIGRLDDESAESVMVRMVRSRVSKKKYQLFIKELTKLSERFDSADAKDGDYYHMVLALYPGTETDALSDQSARINL